MSDVSMSGTVAGEPGNIQAAIDAGIAIAAPEPLDPNTQPLHSIVVPAGGRHELLNIEHLAAAPRRLFGIYRPATVGAFSELVERFSTDEATLWVHPSSGEICAIFNDNDQQQPGWRDHGAVLRLEHPTGWDHWLSRDGRLMTQLEFAEHIEAGLTEIAAPPAAELLEMAQTFQAKTNVNFRTAVRLHNGQVQAAYDEEIDATAGSGQVQIPEVFTLMVPPFLDEQPVQLTARLRYRVNAGKLSLGYKLERPDEVLRAALDAIADRLRTTHASLPVFIGTPR